MITELLDRERIPYLLEGDRHCRPDWAQIDCCYCGPHSGKWHLGIHLERNYANCWKCGPHRLSDVLRQITPLRGKELLEWTKTRETKEIRREKHRGKYTPLSGVGPLLEPHKEYLRSRGFHPEELVKLWGIGGIGVHGTHPWKVFTPILFQGERISWMARSLHDKGTRWVGPSSERETIPRKRILYGWDYVRHAVIVVEGIADVWKVGPGAVATMGTEVTREQEDLLRKIPRRIVCFDSEPAAQKRAGQLLDRLASFPGETIRVELEDSKDPGEASPGELEDLRRMLL